MTTRIERLTAEGLAAELETLGEILHACVHGGAAVNFVLPFPIEAARDYWREKVAAPVAEGTARLLVARVDGETLGTVRLDLVTTPNQPHRASVAKMLVHPKARRRGLGRALMTAAEDEARACGRRLITLDCRADAEAEALYAAAGYIRIGVIPAYSRHPFDGTWDACAFMYKALA
jgi:ribosomal protein S18 acetylase RimI-like enzyme